MFIIFGIIVFGTMILTLIIEKRNKECKSKNSDIPQKNSRKKWKYYSRYI